MKAPSRKTLESRAALDYVALSFAATEAGFELRVRSFPDPNGSATLHIGIWLDERSSERGYDHSHAGEVTLWIRGSYAGDRSMTHVEGVGIALAAKAGIIDEQRRLDHEALNAGNKRPAQQAWLDRAKAEQERRAAYMAELEARYDSKPVATGE